MSQSEKSFTVVHFWRGARRRRPRWNLGDPPRRQASVPVRVLILLAAAGATLGGGLWFLL